MLQKRLSFNPRVHPDDDSQPERAVAVEAAPGAAKKVRAGDAGIAQL